jgi:prolyl-tRNA synthetase
LANTWREDPAEAEIPSHRLMLRAGLMRKLASGIYTFLPLGWRVIRKVEEIIREEMDAAGAQELLLPIVQPAELWEETGRWAEYGEEMWRLQDRHGRRFCLGPTHEEVITDLVRQEVSSYRQLPLILYQIQNKYRDEIRPRFGVMRAREFIMKDAYSFHRDEACLQKTYDRMCEAYSRIFSRLGLEFQMVEADPGAIGGYRTHEFMVLARVGEALLLLCRSCGYAANAERAEARPPEPLPAGEVPSPERLPTPGVRTIEELSRFTGRDPREMAKILFLRVLFRDGREETVAALLRGDRELNPVKLKNALGALAVEKAPPSLAEELGLPLGSAGPVGFEGFLVADPEVMALGEVITGANEEGYHLLHVQPGRDFSPSLTADIRVVEPGDPCPRCGSPLEGTRGIEVGQVFQLGTKYSEAMGATFLDEEGRARPLVMGCYGIGVTRTVGAIIEQHHDGEGIIWPVSAAPYTFAIVPVNVEEEREREVAERIYRAMVEAGLEVLLDDRPLRAGVKFKDADLIGFPYRITVGSRSLAQGKVEVRRRRDGETLAVSPDRVVEVARDLLARRW